MKWFKGRDFAWLIAVLCLLVGWWYSQRNLSLENAYLRSLVMPAYARDHGLTPNDALEMMQREARGDFRDAEK
jgi:hypothetical protein